MFTNAAPLNMGGHCHIPTDLWDAGLLHNSPAPWMEKGIRKSRGTPSQVQLPEGSDSESEESDGPEHVHVSSKTLRRARPKKAPPKKKKGTVKKVKKQTKTRAVRTTQKGKGLRLAGNGLNGSGMAAHHANVKGHLGNYVSTMVMPHLHHHVHGQKGGGYSTFLRAAAVKIKNMYDYISRTLPSDRGQWKGYSVTLAEKTLHEVQCPPDFIDIAAPILAKMIYTTMAKLDAKVHPVQSGAGYREWGLRTGKKVGGLVGQAGIWALRHPAEVAAGVKLASKFLL